MTDKVNGWSEEGWAMKDGESDTCGIGGKLAACMWIYTKAAICDGQRNSEEFWNQKRNSVIEAVNWSCSRVLLNHESSSEFFLMMHEYDILERLKFDIAVPCIVHWASFGIPLQQGGRKLETCSSVENVALEPALQFATSKTFSPRRFLLTDDDDDLRGVVVAA